MMKTDLFVMYSFMALFFISTCSYFPAKAEPKQKNKTIGKNL